MVPGKVYLVGAGPGHPELLTVKAARLIETSDVIVYDRLVQEEVLALAKSSSERIYMGATVGLHSSRQSEIHELLVQKAREGKTVVRLKGGDPFLFGRGGEEAEYLAEKGIPFEVIPGVSSALAAPLSAGIAVTHRDAASSLAIVTGHEANRPESRMNWSALAGIDTVVFLMAVHSVDHIARELMAHGRAPETPAAMIQMAFWHGEQVVTGTLASIAEDIARAGISPPATFVVGEVVKLHDKLSQSRDLRRRYDPAPHFDPSPPPDQLLRIAAAGTGSQVLLFALATDLFAHLEQWRTAQDLARRLGLNTMGLAEILECLVSLGLLEGGPEGYRNLELASRYLLDGSPQTLKPTLLALSAHLAPVTSIGAYALNGRNKGASPEFYRLQKQSCECLARYTAPFVLDKLDLAPAGHTLVVGWGGDAYRELAHERWPKLNIEVRNPFEGETTSPPAAVMPSNGTAYDTVLLSDLLPCCERDEFRPALERAARLVNGNGLVALHDSFVCSERPYAPEVVLAAFRRHVLHGGSRIWTLAQIDEELSALGLKIIRSEPMPGGTYLVTAARA